jgi:fatty-acyl-CoA synthase
MRTGLTIGPPEDIAMTIEALGAVELCNVYGATETYGNCAVTEAPVLRTRQPSRVSTGK